MGGVPEGGGPDKALFNKCQGDPVAIAQENKHDIRIPPSMEHPRDPSELCSTVYNSLFSRRPLNHTVRWPFLVAILP